MATLPPYKGRKPHAEEAFWEMYELKLESKHRMVRRMAEKFWPEKEWNNLTDAQYEMLTHYCNVVMFETIESVRQEHDGLDDYADFL
jgi:hypothetical protein